jgi:CelD/BcsL family acetyltransferase involved in cellulose biosynthesis
LWRQRRAGAFAKLSVGTALTVAMLHHVLAVDGVGEIDFGPGGEPFKACWLRRSRQRGGILVFNPRRWKGLVGAAWHIGGHAGLSVARTARRILRRLTGRA